MTKIPFNTPYITGKETEFIKDAVYQEKKLSGNGKYTQLCQNFFEEKYGFNKCLLTTSCTDALEMAAILLNIQEGDEVIMPSYTFVSTANAFVLRGAKIIFVDTLSSHPNVSPEAIKNAITDKTKAIVVVHYAGVACDMDSIMNLANEKGIFVVEDAAQAVDSYYKDQALGGIGHLAAFSFHETKNISSGEGGMLVINDKQFEKRAETIWEKGTNRAAFFRGEVDKYGWVDVGSSFLPSEITAAFLYAQLIDLEDIQNKRRKLWEAYDHFFKTHPHLNQNQLETPLIPDYACNNAHMYYVVLESLEKRMETIQYLKNKGVHAVFHYLPLHASPFYAEKSGNPALPNTQRYSDCLLRLPFHLNVDFKELEKILN